MDCWNFGRTYSFINWTVFGRLNLLIKADLRAHNIPKLSFSSFYYGIDDAFAEMKIGWLISKTPVSTLYTSMYHLRWDVPISFNPLNSKSSTEVSGSLPQIPGWYQGNFAGTFPLLP
jgi:hypothetical protein